MTDEEKKQIFLRTKVIAVVGLSERSERPSHAVASYLMSEGFVVIPVNPTIEHVLGQKSYPNLTSIPKNIRIDIIDIFRKSEDVFPHIQEAILRKDAHSIWMQEGVIDKKAASLAKRHGLQVVMDTCIMKEHKRLRIS